jgi:hypothetical protein
LQSREDLQQRGLPGSAAAGDGDQFARFHREREIVKDLPPTDAPADFDRIDARAALRFIVEPLHRGCAACQFAHGLISVLSN